MTLTRRSTLALGAAALSGLAAPPARLMAAPPLTELSLWGGPPAGPPSAVLAHAAASGALSGVADTTTFQAWRNPPDELRAGLTSKTITLSVVPVQAAANLYNKGFPIKLVNVMTKGGLLYVISGGDASLTSIDTLAGKSLVVPFRGGDTPDIILERLLEDAGIKDQVAIHNVGGTPVEAIQMMMTGRAEAALLPEPAISAAIMKAKQAGKDLTRVMDIQALWGGVLNGADPPIVPQAGLAVTGPFLAEHGALIPPEIHAALASAAESALADPMSAAKHASGGALKLPPPPVLAQSIQYSQLGVWTASEMRPAIERMLSTMAEVDPPKKIGGKLPDDGFYLL